MASLSAGAVMGVGASFVIVESETVLRKHFREKLALVLTLKNIAASVGFTLVPALTHFLLAQTGLRLGLLLTTITFVPTALGTLTLRSPTPQRASPYRQVDQFCPYKIRASRQNILMYCAILHAIK